MVEPEQTNTEERASDEQVIYTWNNASSPSAAAAQLGMERKVLHWMIKNFRARDIELKRFRRKKRNYNRLREMNDAVQSYNAETD